MDLQGGKLKVEDLEEKLEFVGVLVWNLEGHLLMHFGEFLHLRSQVSPEE